MILAGVVAHKAASPPPELIGSVEISSETTGSGSSGDVNKPTGVVANDVVILVAAIDGSHTDIASSGFSEAGAVDSGGHSHAVLYKVAGGSEPSTYTVTWTGTEEFNIKAMAFRYLDSSTPFIGSSPIGLATSVGDTSPNPPSISCSANNLIIATCGTNASNSLTDYPSNMTLGSITNNNETNFSAICGCAYAIASSSTFDPNVFTTTVGQDWAAFTLEFKAK